MSRQQVGLKSKFSYLNHYEGDLNCGNGLKDFRCTAAALRDQIRVVLEE
jgi:hypothetical protein